MENKEEIQNGLIEKALKEYKKIEPCRPKKSFEECFTYLPDKVIFWFNVEDNSTKVFIHDLS